MYKIIGVDQKEYGPVSADQLRQWITEGRVNGQTKVQAADSTEWKMMGDIPEFASVLPKPQPIAPVPTYAPGMPVTPLPVRPANSQMAIWSMVLGILSLFCCQIIVGPIAIVLGSVALSQMKSRPELTGRGFAIAGIILGILGVLIAIGLGLLIFLSPEFMQNFQKAMGQQ